jgi:autotransporter-associated beta strand protein
LVVDALTNGNTAGLLGASSAVASNLVFGGGTLTYVGGPVSFDRLFTLAPGNSGIESSGTGALTFTGSTGATSGQTTQNRSLTLGGSFVGASNVMSLTFADAGTGLTSLIKAGPGTWTLTGTSSFTGGATIENGNLFVTTASVSAGGLGNGTAATSVVRLGNANSTADVRLNLGNEAGTANGLNLANPIVVSDLNASGNAIVASTNTSGTNALTGPITLGATADTGKSLTLAVAAGGTLAVGGQVRANGTDTTGGIVTQNLTGSGSATITLSAANTYAGGTTVGANTTVIANDTAALGANLAGNALNLQGGTLRYGNVRFAAGVQQSYRLVANDLGTALSGFTSFGTTSTLKMANISNAGTAVRSVASITDTVWGGNETWAYSGQIFIPNGTQVSFGENIDDVAYIKIGSTIVLNNTAALTPTNGGTFTITGGVDGGWHTFEARFGNGAGGAGAVVASGWSNGFGVGVSGILGKTLTTSADGSNFAQLADAGMSLFRYDRGAIPTLVLNNAVNVSADSTLDIGADIGAISLGALSLSGSKLTLAATTTNYASHTFSFAGTTLMGSASLASNATSTINLGALNDAGVAATLTFDGAGTLVMDTAATSLVDGTVIAVNGGKIISSQGTALTNARLDVGASGLFEVAANQTIAGLGGAGSVTLNGRTLTIGAANGLTTTFTGVLSDGTSAGALIKAGTGVLTLSGNNTFVGALTVNAGTLQVGHVSALGTTAAGTTVATGATLDLNGVAVGAEAIALSGRLANTSATAASLSGAVTLGGAALLGSTAGTLTLTGGLVTGSNDLTVDGAGDVVFSGSAGLTGAGLVTKNGAGALTLNAASTADFAAINAGTVTMAGNLNVGALNGGSVNVGAHTLGVTTATTVASDVTSLRFAGGQLNYAGTTPLDRSFTVANGGVKFTANTTARIDIGVASKVDFANTTGTGRTLTLAGTSTAGNAYGASLFDNAEAADRLFTSVVKEGVGAWVMRGTGDTFASTATFDLNAGLLGFTAGALGGVGHTGDIIVTNSGFPTSLRWEVGNTDDVSARLRVPTANVANLVFADAASPVTFNTTLRVEGTAAVYKTGPGTLVLNAANTFSQGGLAVQQGTVQVTAAGGLGSGVERAVVSGVINTNTPTQLIVDSVNTAAGVAADQGGRVSGTGTLGAVDINLGGTIASGNATGGTLTVASLKMAPSSNLEWRVWDASLGAGVGYSRLSVTGALDLSTGDFSTNKISIKLISLSSVGGSVNTIPTGFDPPAGTVRSFTLAEVGSVNYGVGSTNISDYFSVDVSQFKYSNGDASAAGLWSVSFDNANSAIMLTAVPEPSTYGFGLGALALAAAAIRRRRQIKKA